jgi:hypothetical protein
MSARVERIFEEIVDLSDEERRQITSRRYRNENPGYGDYPLKDWKKAGLLLPST